MSMGTMPRTPQRSVVPPRTSAQPMTRPGLQPVTGSRTTMAQRQAYQPFRNNLRAPVPKIDPRAMQPQQQPGLGQAGYQPSLINVPLPDYGPEGDYMPMPNYGNNGQPGLFNGDTVDNSSFIPYTGQLDLTGMMGQQGSQAGMNPMEQYNNYNNAMSGTPNNTYGGGKSTGPSSGSYGGGKSR